ncbi:MAG: 4Fe-4S dicluster domain-containing protein [Thermodesulfobacteriota bacterium]
MRIDEAKCIQCGDCARACMEENPVNHALTTTVQKRFEEVAAGKKIEAPSPLQHVLTMGEKEREAFWNSQFQKCIKCYGCVDMCPVYIPDPDLHLSQWIPGGETPPPYPLFHLIRAYQVWDTCILCGECERTCPAQIPLKTVQDLIEYLPPEKVFEIIPGLENEAKDAIIAFVNQKNGSDRRTLYEL